MRKMGKNLHVLVGLTDVENQKIKLKAKYRKNEQLRSSSVGSSDSDIDF
jgi:hypothetical protein